MADSIRLGAFLLESPISAGGMGTVWRGRHDVTGTPVAVKVLAESFADDPVYLDGFEREVRAVARMQHPRIIRVFDFGFVDEHAAATSEELPLGAPWLAMELATRGSLVHLPGIGDWSTLKAILFDVLDALAHSHARNIIHRDLKPGNILLTNTEQGIRCKLTDFGIAHASGRSMSTREVFATSAGTPWYMAPEQVDSRWRDYGSWTDLYALGCVAYQLATGVTPFVGESVVRVARQQLFDRPPPLEPRFEVPQGFRAWVERLLSKERVTRFRRAADAAWALHQISPRSDESIVPPREPESGEIDAIAPTALAENGFDGPTTDVYDSGVATLTFLENEPEPSDDLKMPSFSIPGSLMTFSVPPMPDSWRAADRHHDARLVGAGLGLYRLREIPFVGREPERDFIWETLRDVVVNRRPRAIVLRGPTGVGKSRLAAWMAQRAHELGVTTTMSARHSPVRGPAHGLGAMMERYLRCGGLDFERSYLRIRRLVTAESTEPPDAVAYYSAAVAHIIHGEGQAQGVPAVRFTNPDERYQVVRRLLESVSSRRPVMALFDDVHWGYDALAFAQRMLQTEAPVLFVVTVRDEVLRERPLERDALRELEALDAVDSLQIGPLSRAKHLDVIDQLLVLEPPLRQRVLDLTYGSPLFAAELLGDWVRKGVLESSPDGFRLAGAVKPPQSLHALWNQRLDDVLRNLDDPATARVAVEMGAALGTTVDRKEWREACANLGLEIPSKLLDLLADHGLIETEADSWSFLHQMLRDSISREARDAGRASGQHRVVADMLQYDEVPDNQLRRALHCLAVNDSEAAARPLTSAFDELMQAGRMPEATAVLGLLDDVLQDLPAEHPVRPRTLELRLRLYRRLGDHEKMKQTVDEFRPLVEERGWQNLLSTLHRVDAIYLLEKGRLQEAESALEQALELARESRDPATLGAIHGTLGWMDVRYRGAVEDARAHFEAARDHHRIASDIGGELRIMMGLSETERQLSNFAGARRYVDEAIAIARQYGYRWVLAGQYNQRGEIAMAERDWEGARRFYAEALELAEMIGGSNVPVYRLNLAMATLYDGPLTDVRPMIEDSLQDFERRGWLVYAFYARLGLLAVAASSGDTGAWDDLYEAQLEDANPAMATREGADHSIAAAERWVDRGEHERANQAYDLARQLMPDGFRDELGQRVAEGRRRIGAARKQISRD